MKDILYEIGWLQDPAFDRWISVDPDGDTEYVSADEMTHRLKMGRIVAPKWVAEAYPDWLNQVMREIYKV